MIHPSYTELMNVINKDVEPGEQPAIQSRYSLVIATSKRARQIIDGAAPYVDGKGKKPLSVAIEEVYKGKVNIVGDVADNEDSI